MKKINILLLSIFMSLPVWAQNATQGPEMADIMRSNGKIYVVVAVLVLIFIGILFYLIQLDSRISNIEKEIEN